MSKNPASKPITVNGITYPSKAECARAHGIPPVLFRRRLNQGRMDIKRALSTTKFDAAYPTVNDEAYYSIAQCADTHDIPRQRIYNRLRAGMTLEQAVQQKSLPHGHSLPVTYDGKTYPSKSACARALNIPPGKFSKCIHDGMSVEDAVEECRKDHHKPITVNGVTYPSKIACAKAHGINPITMHNRIKKGMPPEDAVKPPKTGTTKRKRTHAAITFNDITYQNATAFANANGLPPDRVLGQIQRNVPLELILRGEHIISMTTNDGTKIHVPFTTKPTFAFTNANHIPYYYAQCPVCERILVLTEQELKMFRHDETACETTCLPPQSHITNTAVKRWLYKQRRKSS